MTTNDIKLAILNSITLGVSFINGQWGHPYGRSGSLQYIHAHGYKG